MFCPADVPLQHNFCELLNHRHAHMHSNQQIGHYHKLKLLLLRCRESLTTSANIIHLQSNAIGLITNFSCGFSSKWKMCQLVQSLSQQMHVLGCRNVLNCQLPVCLSSSAWFHKHQFATKLSYFEWEVTSVMHTM